MNPVLLTSLISYHKGNLGEVKSRMGCRSVLNGLVGEAVYWTILFHMKGTAWDKPYEKTRLLEFWNKRRDI